MADFVATIKVNIEAATGGTASGGSGGGTGDGGVDITGPIVRTIQQLQEEFRNLSAQVRSVATSLEQIRNVQGASSGTGAPSDVSGVDQSLVEILKALLETGTAAKGAADATKEQTAATDEATRATKESADAKSQEADMHAKAAREAEAHARASEAATAADRARAKALKEIQGGAPVRAQPTIGGGAGRLSDVRIFEDLIKSIGQNPDLRKLAAQTSNELSNLIKIPEGANAEIKREGEELKRSIGTILRGAISDIKSGLGTTTTVSAARKAITAQVGETRERLPTGAQVPTADTTAIVRGLAAKALDFEITRVNTKIAELGKAIEEGADAIKITQLKQASDELLASLVKLTRGVAPTLFSTDRRTGREPITGGADILRGLRAEGVARAPALQFGPEQLRAFTTLRESINSSVAPIETIRRVVSDLVDQGRGLGGLRENLLGFVDSVKGLREEDFPDRQKFLNFQEALKALNKVKIDERFGQITGPVGAVSQEDAVVSGQRAVQLARQRLAEQAATRGPTQVGPVTDSLDLQLPTATGGIRKVRVELEALGTTVDSVKVKAKDLSNNMFDRTSVRAALQRVAVWSAAAGLVFGAFTALRQGVSVIIDTESALISLAKVMNESAVDMVAFKNTAQEAALAIANDFGQPLEQTLETMILFGQQGKNLIETISLSRAAALAASVTTLDQPEAASALTAATQQFGLAFSEAESIVDKFNEVSNNAAVTETDLAQALKKAGQAARLAGLDLDQFNGVVSAIAEQTRQSGNEIGTALRFIFSRLQTPEAESGLAQIGVSARDAAGNVRPFTSLIEELAGKFDTLTASQKTQVAISVAGTRRFNTLLALLDNFSRFQQSAADSANSAGSALREQEKVTETAAFKIEQLKNSLKELALSFGDSLLDPMKLAVGTLSSLVGIISAIPGSIKTMVAGIGIGSLAFLKFSDHITDFLGLAGSVKDATAVIGGSLRTNITQGLSRPSQISRFGEDAFTTTALGVTAARAAPDINLSNVFGKNKAAVSAFSKELASSNLILKTQRGIALESSAAFGKFGSTIRGFSVESTKGLGTTALALGGLNSGITKFGAFLGILANRITRTIPVVSTLFERLDIAAGKSGKATTALIGTFGRFAVAGAAIFGIVKAFQAISDAAFESAEEVASELEPEIQRRKEAIALLGEQEQRVKSLTDARRKAASVTSPGAFERLTAPQEQDVLSGSFRSSIVAIQRIRAQEQDAANQIGFANPELIDSIDEFGNVVLSSADSFDTLARAAGDAQEVLLGLTQVDIIGAFSKELDGSVSLFSGFVNKLDDALSGIFLGGIIPDDAFTTTKQRFDEALADFKESLNAPEIRQARSLGVSVAAVSPEKSKELGDAGRKFQQQSLEVRRVVETSLERIRSLPADSSQLVFEALSADAKEVFEAQVDLLSTQGVETNVRGLINQARLQNLSALKDVRDQIAASPALTVGQLRESGRPLEIVDIDAARKNIEDLQKELLRFTGGELIIFKDVEGIDRQAVVEVTATGKRQISFVADSLGTFATQELSDVFSTAIGDVQFIDPDKIKSQLTSALQEIGRIVSGAGRGGLLQKDLELGVDFRSDLTAQQRAAQGDELLFTDLQAAQEQLTSFRESFGAPTKEGQESPSQLTDPENVAAVQEMARAIDELATKAKLAVEIEEVGIAFEKAVDKIKNSRIEEVVSAEFSGALGATTGALKRAFERPVLPQNLDATAVSDRQSQGLVELGNVLSRVQQANGEMIAGLQVASRNIDTFVRDFENAGVAGGARDPNRLSDLARRSAALTSTGVDRAQAILTTINSEQLTAQERTNEILTHINANLQDEPRLIGAALAQSVLAARGDEEGIAAVASAIEAQSGSIAEFTPQDLQTILSSIPAKLIPSVVQQFRESQARGAAGGLTTSLLGIGGGEERASIAAASGLERLRILAEKGAFGEEAQRGARGEPRSGIPEEVAEKTATALQAAISTAFSDDQFAKILSDPNRLGEIELDAGKIEEVLRVAITSLEDSGNKSARQAADEIKAALDQGGEKQERILSSVRSAILQTVDVGTPSISPTVEVGKSLQQTREEADKLAAAMEATVRANDAILKPLRDATGAFFAFKDAIVGVTGSLRGAVQQAADDIAIGRDTQRFTTPQVGLLAGVSLANSAPDQRRRVSDLSGGELTALESPQLSRGLNEVNAAFGALVGQLGNVKQEQINAQRALEGFQAENNIRGVKLAQEALVQLGSISNLVEGQINNAQGTLKKFGESFRDVEAVNQLRVDVEKLVESFDREITLRFDRTSIASALGNTLFSATRPTFEQFEQGQSGFLTKFERSLASIDFQESAGTITRQEATRGRAEVEFTKAEDIIALAQSRENEKLQAAVSSAEQVRSRLFDFVQTGAPGTEVAQRLLDQITSELESAGDIVPGGSGRTSIRDPRTGREVDVQASAINTFRGLPGLGNITQQLTQLSQSATKTGAQENADLITKPLLTVLDKIPSKLDEVVSELKKAGDLEDPASDVGRALGGTELTQELSRILAPLQREEPLSAAAVKEISSSLANISRLDPDTLAGLLQRAVVAPGGTGTEQPLEEFLRQTLTSAQTAPGTSDKGDVLAGINSVFEQANKSTVARFELLETPVLSVATAGELAADNLGLMSGATETVTSKLTEASDAITKFTSSLKGGLSDVFKSVGERVRDFFGGSVQKRAQGGLITGPGGPTEDRVPVMASPGEFVINAKAANKIGLERLNQLNDSDSTIGRDASAVGARSKFAFGGLVDFTGALQRHQAEAAKRKLASVGREDDPQAKLQELLAKRSELLAASPPKTEEAEVIQPQIKALEEEVLKREQAKEKDRKRLEELREAGARQLEIEAGAAGGTGSGIIIPDTLVNSASREELAQEERSRRDELAKRRFTFQGAEAGRTFVRLSEDGKRFVYQSDSSGGAIDVNTLRGVSTRDTEEFLAEVERRRAFGTKLSSADADRARKKKALETEFATLLSREQEEREVKDVSTSRTTAVASLEQLLREKSSSRLERIFRTYGNAQSAISSSQELLSKGDLSRDDGHVQAESLEQILLNIEQFKGFLAESEVSPVSIFDQGQKKNIGLDVRAVPGTTNVGLDFNNDPFAFGELMLSNPEVEEQLQSLSRSGLEAQLRQQIKALRGPRLAGAVTSAVSENLGFKATTDFLGDLQVAIKQDLGQESKLARVVGGARVITGLGDEIVSGTAGLAAGIAGGEGNELIGAIHEQAVNFTADAFEDPSKAAKSLYETGTNQDTDEIRAIKKRIANATNPAEKQLAQRSLNDAQFRRNKETVGLLSALFVPTARLAKLSKAKFAPNLSFTKRGRQLNQLSKIDSPQAASDLAVASQKSAVRTKRTNPSASKDNAKFAELAQKRAQKLQADIEAAQAAKDAARLAADQNAVRIGQRTGGEFSRNLTDAQVPATFLEKIAGTSGQIRSGILSNPGVSGFLDRRKAKKASIDLSPDAVPPEAGISLNLKGTSVAERRAVKQAAREAQREAAEKAARQDALGIAPAKQTRSAAREEAKVISRLEKEAKLLAQGKDPSKPGLLKRAALGASGIAGGALGLQALGLGKGTLAALGLPGLGLGIGAIGGLGVAGAFGIPRLLQLARSTRFGRPRGPTLADRVTGLFSRRESTAAPDRGFATGLEGVITEADLGELIPNTGRLDLGIPSDGRGFAPGLDLNDISVEDLRTQIQAGQLSRIELDSPESLQAAIRQTINEDFFGPRATPVGALQKSRAAREAPPVRTAKEISTAVDERLKGITELDKAREIAARAPLEARTARRLELDQGIVELDRTNVRRAKVAAQEQAKGDRLLKSTSNPELLAEARAAFAAEKEIAKQRASAEAITSAQRKRRAADLRRADNRDAEIGAARAQLELEAKQARAAESVIDSLDTEDLFERTRTRALEVEALESQAVPEFIAPTPEPTLAQRAQFQLERQRAAALQQDIGRADTQPVPIFRDPAAPIAPLDVSEGVFELTGAGPISTGVPTTISEGRLGTASLAQRSDALLARQRLDTGRADTQVGPVTRDPAAPIAPLDVSRREIPIPIPQSGISGAGTPSTGVPTLIDELLGATGGLGSGFGAAGPIVDVLGRRAAAGIGSAVERLLGKKTPAADILSGIGELGIEDLGASPISISRLTREQAKAERILSRRTGLLRPLEAANLPEEAISAIAQGKSGIVEDVVRSISPSKQKEFFARRLQLGAEQQKIIQGVDPEFLGDARILKRSGELTIEELSFDPAADSTVETLKKLREIDPNARSIPKSALLDSDNPEDIGIIESRLEEILGAEQGTLAGKFAPDIFDLFLNRDKSLFELHEKFSPAIRKARIGEGPLPETITLSTPNKPSVEEILKQLQQIGADTFATGGKINGPGGPTSDRIPILASAGEFVLNANAVGKLGLPVVESMNRTGILPKFQNGGLIEDEDRARTPGQVLGRGPDLFDIISGRAGGIDVGAALKSTGDTRNKKLYINNRTGEEVLASGLLAEDLESQGFSLAPVSPDLELLSALADGKKVYTNSRTGESVTASEAADRELRARGFRQDNRPLSELLQGGLLQNSDGSLTLLSPGDSGVVGPRTPEERARLASAGLQAQREANIRFSEGATAGLASQREANARFSAGAQSALVASQGRTEMSTVLPGNTGSGSRLQRLADELELERFNAGGLLRGPGGPKSDDIPILASNGEFIVNADAAGKLGLATLEQLNTTGKLPGFQNGGDVSGRSSGGSVSVNTEEIAAAIREAIIQATSEASITIDTETAADSISSAISRALAGMEFPDVKLDTSSLNSLSLGNSVGADIISKVKLLEGSVTRISDSTNDILDDLSELNVLKDSFARQEEDILNKVEFRINKENSITTTSTGPSTVNLDRDIKIIRAEMLRLERDLQQTTTQASLALSKAQAK